ncbi:MAG: glycosyltransferase family 9 protein [Actinomycetota bacterium]|nr:glycosyltransferase family 9 protein [Actinomycetota bacterium]
MDDVEPNGVTAPAALPSEWASIRNLLVVRLDNVGDLVMLSPALRTLRASLPETRITLMASAAGPQVAPLLPWLDDLMVERVVWQDASGQLELNPDRERALVEQIAARHFDAALIFTSFSQSPWPPAYACYLAGIPLRAGQSADFGGSLLTNSVPALEREAHQVDRNLHLLESLGFVVRDRHLEVAIPIEAQAAAAQLLAGFGLERDQPFVALAAGASCAARRYPPERSAEVATRLADTGLPVVVLGGPREVDLLQPVLDRNRGRPVWSLVGRTSVAELAAVLARAAIVVTNDSGPMHLADAVGRPQVVLFSGTDLESQWRPRASPSRLLRRPTACSPCYRFDCPFELECLDIPAEEVVDHVLDLVGGTVDRRSSPLLSAPKGA